jgi:hypothetical protein
MNQPAVTSAATPITRITPVVHEGIAYVSGQLPRVGRELHVRGKVGAQIDLEAARSAARLSYGGRSGIAMWGRTASLLSPDCWTLHYCVWPQ